MSKPEAPKFATLQTPDMAVASAIDKLTSEEKIMFLANIDRNEIPRFSLLLSIAEDFKLSWLKTYVYSELKLTCSIKGRRADQLENITKQPEIMTQDGGIINKVGRRLRR
mgnify:CR=1 FL=1